ncbi:50S ribosomal protein L32e [Candidatus Bathyarchaeota archaeon]|jgi:large subunit ribosomal protein L32e|nr:50S ribosomal protein L32e [Candidatus Bathyarchaeota archaeon]MBT4321300.1 50S ribosomal protein L32e [Candidatus Bathyarchaeota archaeon]MBT4424101.1 50S ribosomal protein L32e [Candidatus Bathyarchaeota archaeon]MBT5643153.1 50S ribosomal protein L32e [Candidatus Bathyarchaeota archaeon]MBT6604124.1 50S ribosomal protein L32e [Candidatus Bathyarchaeota archaeon]
MEQKEKKRLLKVRARISKKRPHFKRFESWRFVRIKDQWRKPRGIDNKMRTELQGWPKSVKIGYRGPKAVRGLHSSGMEEVMVWNAKDIAKVDPETQVARIGGTVGGKKKETILAKAEELKIRILNPGVIEPEDDFENLDDEEEEEEKSEENESEDEELEEDDE